MSSSMENPHPMPNPNSTSEKHNPNTQRLLEALMENLLSTHDFTSPSFSSQISHALEDAFVRCSNAEKINFLNRSVLLGAKLEEAAHRLRRKHDTSCNYAMWPLTYDLTIKVFSLLGVHSLSQAAASCSLFKKVAMEPACYREIDLTDQQIRVDNKAIAKLIERAGQHLCSLKLGLPAVVNGNMFLTKSCLEPLLVFGGMAGALLQTLHLQNIVELDTKNVCKVLYACPGLSDLEIIGLHVNERRVMRSITLCCHKLTRLSLQSPKTESSKSWISYSMRSLPCSAIVNGCPNLLSLSLRGFKLPDHKVKLLLKGLHHLEEADFSGADLLTGSFLRDVVLSEGKKLKSLKLCDCLRLKLAEVNRLLSSLSAGECKNLRFLDVSNKDGLVSSDWTHPRASLNEEILLLLRIERPELELYADFCDKRSSSDCDSMSLASSFGYSEYTEPIHLGCHAENILSEDSQSLRSGSIYDTELDSEEDENDNDSDGDGDDDDDDDDDDEDDEDDDVESNLVGDLDEEDEDTEFLSPCYLSEAEDIRDCLFY